MKPLYVVTVIFNPRRFSSRHRLYTNFAAWLERSGVSLLTVEIAFGERPFAITESGNPWHLQLHTRQELWHKERALNLGLQRLGQLMPDWGYVAWMDADIKLARDDWAQETVHLLQHYAVLQLFGEARSLGPDHHTLFSCRSMGRNYADYGKLDWGQNPGVNPLGAYAHQGHPGLGWAFRRDELNDIGGWLDVCINGSGDLHMAGCYAGNWQLALSPECSTGYRQAIRRYGQLCAESVHCNVSYLPGAVDHYFHGKSSQRGYQERWKLVDAFQFDPSTDLVPDRQGLWKWHLTDPRVRSLAIETRKSLARRNEDSTEA